jgi:hypothetical protein
LVREAAGRPRPLSPPTDLPGTPADVARRPERAPHGRGQVVTKSQLLDLVWPDVAVEESNVQVQVSALRKCVGPDVCLPSVSSGSGRCRFQRQVRPRGRRPTVP